MKMLLLSIAGAALLCSGAANAENAGVVGKSTSISNSSIEQQRPVPSANVRHLYKRGVVNFEQGDLLMAKRFFSEILETQPLDASAHFYMARIKSQRNDQVGALEHYQVVLNQYPNAYGVMAGMGQSYAKTSQYGDAYRLLDILAADAKVCANTCANARIIDQSIAIINTALNQ